MKVMLESLVDVVSFSGLNIYIDLIGNCSVAIGCYFEDAGEISEILRMKVPAVMQSKLVLFERDDFNNSMCDITKKYLKYKNDKYEAVKIERNNFRSSLY